MTIEEEIKKRMLVSLGKYQEDLRSIRTGRASPHLIEGVSVDLYGSKMHVRDIAQISVPDPRSLLITPYNSQDCTAIVKGMEKSDLGFQARVEGASVRVLIPPMDQSQREMMVKLCHKELEKCKIAIRLARRDGFDELKKKRQSGEIAEDQERRAQKKIQDFTDQYCKDSDQICSVKEKEILTI